MIDSRVVEIMVDNVEIPYDMLQQDIIKDFYTISFLLAEKLPDSTPFDLAHWDIVDFNEDTIVIHSNEKEWLIKFENVYSYDEKVCIDFRFYVIRE